MSKYHNKEAYIRRGVKGPYSLKSEEHIASIFGVEEEAKQETSRSRRQVEVCL
jgi:hypothetical protein